MAFLVSTCVAKVLAAACLSSSSSRLHHAPIVIVSAGIIASPVNDIFACSASCRPLLAAKCPCGGHFSPGNDVWRKMKPNARARSRRAALKLCGRKYVGRPQGWRAGNRRCCIFARGNRRQSFGRGMAHGGRALRWLIAWPAHGQSKRLRAAEIIKAS